jgi:uridine kinase
MNISNSKRAGSMRPHIIGISGKTGAGKSTLARMLSLELNATLVCWDDFDSISTEPEDYVSWYHRGRNYSEFEREALAKVLEKLKNGENVVHPILKQLLTATPYIIFDAPLGRSHSETGQYIDTMIHIEVPLDILLCRRLLRDFKETTATKDDILKEIEFYLENSRPLFDDTALKGSADLVLDGLLTPIQELEHIIGHLFGKDGH